MNIKHKITTTVLAASLALTSASGMAQYIDRPGSETNTSETGITRTPHESMDNASKDQRLPRGDGEWAFESTRGFEYLAAMRMDAESAGTADMLVSMLTDPDLIEDEMDAEYVDSFRIRGDRDCEGVELDMDGLPIYMVVCADGRYLHMVLGTNEDDVIDAALDMQDGYIPAPVGYVEVQE